MTTLLRSVVGSVLRNVRIEQRRTLREVSDLAQVSLGYLSEVERGSKEISSELLNAICGALNIKLSQVLIYAIAAIAEFEPISYSANAVYTNTYIKDKSVM